MSTRSPLSRRQGARIVSTEEPRLEEASCAQILSIIISIVVMAAKLAHAQESTEYQIREAQRLHREGRFDEAEQLLFRARQEQEKRDPKGVWMAVVSNKLGNVYVDLGRYFDAEKLFSQALKILESTAGADARETVPTRDALACLYLEIGDY